LSHPSPRPDPPERVVVKLGSAALATVDLPALVAEMVAARANGVEVVVVSSGAVSSGMERLGLRERPTELARVQALAAVGQVDLLWRYREAFGAHGVHVAQILLTHDDLAERPHYLAVRHTLRSLLDTGVVPIVNENDSVATEELRFGDNDRLAAAVASLTEADLLVLLSDVDALYDRDPRQDAAATPLRVVPAIDGAVRALAGDAGSAVGTGGMRSKVEAAALAVRAGIETVLARGSVPGVLGRILTREPGLGTRFLASSSPASRRRHWIGTLSRVRGGVRVDAGAAEALLTRGSSLLPVGVTAVHGDFPRGASVSIEGPDGVELGRGLAGIPAGVLRQIMGLRRDQIRGVLGTDSIDPVIHRNDMLIHTATEPPTGEGTP